MNRAAAGITAGILGVANVLFLWIALALPARLIPRFGFNVGLVFMSAGVLLTGLAAVLHSKWWLLAVASAIATFALFWIAGLS